MIHALLKPLRNLKSRSLDIGLEVYAIAHAARDPRVPWYARGLAILIVAYALSPLDLIPDPIPVLGLLDDVILLPLGITLLVRLIPEPVLAENRAKVNQRSQHDSGFKWAMWGGTGLTILIWVLVLLLLAWLVHSIV